jgi:hypothetical protein
MLHLGNVGMDIIRRIQLELKNNPQVWNQYDFRRKDPSSPHHGLDDIWVRYQHLDDVNPDIPCNLAMQKYPHESVWYPSIMHLPSIKELAYEIMGKVKGERLGGVLITRIKPGKECKPHVDTGTWHAAYYNCKVAVQLECAPDEDYHSGKTDVPEQAFHFPGEHFCAKQGDYYWFDNQYCHWVPNNSKVDRITIIICIRTDREDMFSKFLK